MLRREVINYSYLDEEKHAKWYYSYCPTLYFIQIPFHNIVLKHQCISGWERASINLDIETDLRDSCVGCFCRPIVIMRYAPYGMWYNKHHW